MSIASSRSADAAGEPWTLGNRPALDGLRGLAVLLVLAGHTRWQPVELGGSVGVTVFFTLSGFLITALLLAEHSRTGRVSLLAFYKRRAARLLPALGAFLLTVLLVGAVWSAMATTLGELFAVLAYVANWPIALCDSMESFPIKHLWSLSVEEQFYIVWPLVVMVFAGRGPKLVAWLAGVGMFADWLWRTALIAGGASTNRLYFGTDLHIDALLAGCLLAALLHGRRAPTVPGWVAYAGLTGIGLLFFTCGSALACLFVMPTLAPLAAIAVLATIASGWAGVLGWKPLRWLGLRSYALYLWHYPLMVILPDHLPASRWSVMPVLIALSFVAAELSWRCVERPMQRLVRRSATDAVRPAALSAHRPDAGLDGSVARCVLASRGST